MFVSTLRRLMDARRYTVLLSLFVALLGLGAAALGERPAGGAVPAVAVLDGCEQCAEESLADERCAGDCAGCLACCARFVASAPEASARRGVLARVRPARAAEGPYGPPQSVWHPPRG